MDVFKLHGGDTAYKNRVICEVSTGIFESVQDRCQHRPELGLQQLGCEEHSCKEQGRGSAKQEKGDRQQKGLAVQGGGKA